MENGDRYIVYLFIYLNTLERILHTEALLYLASIPSENMGLTYSITRHQNNGMYIYI